MKSFHNSRSKPGDPVSAITKLQTFCVVAFKMPQIDTTEEEDRVNQCIRDLWKSIDRNPTTADVMQQYSVADDGSEQSQTLVCYPAIPAIPAHIFARSALKSSKRVSGCNLRPPPPFFAPTYKFCIII